MFKFVDRKDQMDLLEKAWTSENAQFIVLYGRRRVGKTRLILEFIEGKEGIFYIAEDENPRSQIKELKNSIAYKLQDDFLSDMDIENWKDLFNYLKKVLPEDKKFYLAIDEFSYLIKNDNSLASALQKFWDTFLSNTNTCLIVSGSLFGLMQEKVLSHSSPLYGRRTRDIFLESLSFVDSTEFLNMTFKDQMKTYMTIGGIPEYLLKAHDYDRYGKFADDEILSKNGYFYREPYFILSQEFKTIKTYFTILDAISKGNTRPTDIANYSGIETRGIYPYLENLIRLGFIERQVPITGDNRSGIYIIKYVVFDFWFNFVHRYREQIERDMTIHGKNDFNRYFGKRFEELIRTELIGYFFDHPMVGRWWFRDMEIDIVGLDEEKDEILFVECNWSDDVDPEKIYRQLKEKKDKVLWGSDSRKERYAIFAKSFAADLSEDDLTCIDLKDIEDTLLSLK